MIEEATDASRDRPPWTIALQQKVKGWEVTQAEAARRLGVTQPRLNDLLRSKIDKFSLDMLINLAIHAGISVRLDIAA